MTAEILRPYQPGDAPLLAALYQNSVRTLAPAAYTPAQVDAWASYPEDLTAFEEQLESGTLRVAEINGTPAAFGLLEENDHIAFLYTHPQHTRKGLASLILTELETIARNDGQLLLDTDASLISKPFFLHHLFHTVSRESVERQGSIIDRYHLSKLLLHPTASRWLILGNSASGKSTTARRIAACTAAPILDLDTIAWKSDTETPTRRDLTETHAIIDTFTRQNPSWIIEGCYEDLIQHAATPDTILIYLNSDTETCLHRAQHRAHEPHKYPTPQAQQNALPHLNPWITQYPHRQGPMSQQAHRQTYQNHPGPKHATPPLT
jgi:adenylate kinase family enzyme/GNAT superfamily N-acetyltransferase